MKVFPRTLSLFFKKWVVQCEFDKVFRLTRFFVIASQGWGNIFLSKESNINIVSLLVTLLEFKGLFIF